jgi:ketosteroid isomerase-like protein
MPRREMTPDAEKKRDLIHRHAQAELESDWDGALATMIDEPFYEHYPLGVQVRGRAAVKEQWERLLAGTDFVSRATGARLLEWFSGDIAVQMYEWEVEGPDGTKVPSRSWAIFTFKDGLIESERIFSDVVGGEFMEPVFAAEFMGRSGVEAIPSETVAQAH